jgi:hypothetical protein
VALPFSTTSSGINAKAEAMAERIAACEVLEMPESSSLMELWT